MIIIIDSFNDGSWKYIQDHSSSCICHTKIIGQEILSKNIPKSMLKKEVLNLKFSDGSFREKIFYRRKFSRTSQFRSQSDLIINILSKN